MPRSSLLLATAVAALLLAAAPAAQAACPDQPLSRPFTPWLDFARYQLAPDGSFADGAAGWTLGNGASVSGGALSIPAGAAAVSPPICVTPAHPTLRFFTRGTGTLVTSVIANGVELPVGTVVGLGNAWNPSPIQLIVLNLLGEQDVQFRFTSVLGTIGVDDVWIDPYSKG
jgi:hypothetical protein